MVWEASQWGNRARLFPVSVALPTLGLALLQVGVLLRTRKARDAVAAGVAGPSADTARSRGVHIVAWVLAMALASVVLGFELAAGLVTFVFLRVACHERARTSFTAGLVMYLIFYGLFDRALLVPFPAGSLAQVLGLDEPLDHHLLDPLAALMQTR